MSEAAPAKPRMSLPESLRRGLVKVSYNDTHKALHGYGVALAMLEEIRIACKAAIAQNAALEPQGLLKFIDDNQAQLDPATAQIVLTEEKTDARTAH